MSQLRKILIANRGEIALRILRTCKKLGYRSVAVYSDADRNAPHVTAADQAVHIGPSPAKESYLAIAQIIAAGQRSGATAVHPGYGFLAENADFARACADAGLSFIGPSPAAIELMGNKRQAKLRMIEAGVPCIPGYEGADQSDDRLVREAKRIGLPVMVKAAAGGGGRGMRLVSDEAQLVSSIHSARSEARNAFGSDELILERAVLGARHVEIQVFADTHGNLVHLGERDCSIQRRHQKIVEESPSPAMTERLRARMGEVAVSAARAIDYVGAGTIEFLLAPSGEFYFMEMNTRLQVEHPVTEMITGVDLVAWQLAVAAGARLPLSQEEIRWVGHAIEVRLCAEDPAHGFLPQSGKLLAFHVPEGEGLRVDHGVCEGQDIGAFYDSMQAKVIAHGPSREVARCRLLRALEDFCVLGIVTNKDFLVDVLSHETFIGGAYDTAFVPTHYPESVLARLFTPPARHAALAAVAIVHDDAQALREAAGIDSALLHWNSAYAHPNAVKLACGDLEMSLSVRALQPDHFEVEVNGQRFDFRITHAGLGFLHYLCDGVMGQARYVRGREGLWLHAEGATSAYMDTTLKKPEAAAGMERALLAPMDGKVLAVHAHPGKPVRKGDTLVVIEAMKMELQIIAGLDGTVEAVQVSVDAQVRARQVLVTLLPSNV